MNRLQAASTISIITTIRKPAIAAAAMVSYFRWPYGWSWSGGLRATRTPTSAPMFEKQSVREWKPSETMLTAPVR